MVNIIRSDYGKFLRLRREVNIHLDKKPLKDNKKLIAKTIKDAKKVLDIGAGDLRMKRYLHEVAFKGKYFSMDNNKKSCYDFHDINKIGSNYDAVLLLELIEHLYLDTGIEYLKKAVEATQPGGIVVISTPNIDCVGHLWSSDITHIQHYPLRDLCALLLSLGCENKFYVHKTYMRYFYGRAKILEPLNKILRKILRIDYEQGILIFAKKLC